MGDVLDPRSAAGDVEKVLPITDGWGLDGGEQEGAHFTP